MTTIPIPNPPPPLSPLPNHQPASTKPTAEPAVLVAGLAHRYGERLALAGLDLSVAPGEVFAVLGPNGGGKTTLFRLLATLLPLQTGRASIFGLDVARETAAVRASIGVVFQAPSLDRKLTVAENVNIQGALYGVTGAELARRRDALLDQFGLRDRSRELVEKLSGGLKRRVELAKGLLHEPRLLLLDEPSTGLDPAARSDLWRHVRSLRDEKGTTVLVTTHYLDEAEAADRLAILHEGKLVALGPPEKLKADVGGDSITIETTSAEALAAAIEQQFDLPARVLEGSVRLEVPDGHRWISRLAEAFPGQIASIRLGRPSLEDVFIARTGHRYAGDRSQS